jgi:TPR repeat protein
VTGTSLQLEPGWDAALTYDVLDGAPAERPVFVGREDLLGSLVNAISQPDRRGTYLVAGYRGAGKTSLVIEAARRAQAPLEIAGRRLLPLVLNVSEVSASLEPATDARTPPLGIDARRLLTALLRALRNGLGRRQMGDGGALLARVQRACRKAEAAQYAERERRLAELASSEVSTTTRSFAAPNALKAVAAVAGVGFLGVQGAVVFGASLQALAVALAGVAVLSFASSRVTERKTSEQETADTELVFDNSLHQVESDLKEILADLHAQRFRTMFVLEELDKVEDEEGEQLDAVIRYFKNLFTQAPALFFFLTDKRYFDLVDGKIAEARTSRSYAVEHTFFTHRLFVSRPALHECLDYFAAVLSRNPEGVEAIEHIRATSEVRYRPAGDMTPTERFLRVLLFASQNHLFDLKNEMRRYVRVGGTGSRLEFDDASFPAHEQALAGFHFLLEQKADLYHFGGGRDYANEILRNCLSSVFADLGGDAVQYTDVLYPRPGGLGAQLRLAERQRIAEAVDSLLADLERGRAVEPVVETAETGERRAAWRWRSDAAVGFAPVPKLETHEQALVDQLERAARIARQMGDGPLTGMTDRVHEWAAFARVRAGDIDEIRRAPPMTVERAQEQSAGVARSLERMLEAVHAGHRDRLAARGWQLTPVDRRLTLAASPGDSLPPRVVVVHGTEEAQQPLAQRTVADLAPGPAAILLVDDDPALGDAERAAVLARWRAAVAQPGRPVLVSLLALGEGMADADEATARWGERTSDEIALALMWTAQMLTVLPPGVAPDDPVWLRPAGGEAQRCESLAEALGLWLAGPDRVLGAPSAAGNDGFALIRTAAELAAGADPPRLLHDSTAAGPVLPAGYPLDRLVAAGRLIVLDTWASLTEPLPAGARAAVTALQLPEPLAGESLSLLAAREDPAATRALAEFVGGPDRDLAARLYQEAADAGDPYAMAELIGEQPDAAGVWIGPLLSTGVWDAVMLAADRVTDGARAGQLVQAAAEAGYPLAMARMPGLDPDRADDWIERLIASRDWVAVRDAAARAPGSSRAARLLEAAAEGGDTDAMAELIRRGAAGSERWEEPLIATGNGLRLWRLAQDLDHQDPERGLRFHRAAASAPQGDVDSMLEVLVRCAQSDPEASRENQERLAAREDWERLRQAAERLRETDPERAAEIDALIPAD